MTDSKDLKGIYVRIGYPESEVLWLDGHEVVEKAYHEAFETGDSLTDVLLTKNQVINLHQQMYNEYGVYLGEKEVRQITTFEAVRFLGRYLQICRFLTTQEDATRFVKILSDGGDAEELNVARRIHNLIPMLPQRVPSRHNIAALKKFAGTAH